MYACNWWESALELAVAVMLYIFIYTRAYSMRLHLPVRSPPRPTTVVYHRIRTEAYQRSIPRMENSFLSVYFQKYSNKFYLRHSTAFFSIYFFLRNLISPFAFKFQTELNSIWIKHFSKRERKLNSKPLLIRSNAFPLCAATIYRLALERTSVCVRVLALQGVGMGSHHKPPVSISDVASGRAHDTLNITSVQPLAQGQ